MSQHSSGLIHRSVTSKLDLSLATAILSNANSQTHKTTVIITASDGVFTSSRCYNPQLV